MAFDSSANLLLEIGADASSATDNISRFRGLLSKDLSQIGAEFSEWATKVFGSMGSMQGAVMGGTAAALAGMTALAAGAVMVGKELWDLAEKTAKYAEEIEDGTEKTGMSAEAMSGLRYSAQNANVSYEALVGGLGKFSAAIAAAQDPTSKEADALRKLGLSTADIRRSQQDMLPALYKVSDGFREHAKGVALAVESTTVFGKKGTDLIGWLSQGSAGMKQFAEEAKRLGLVLSEQDLIAAKAFRLESAALKAEMEGLAVTIGMGVVPYMTTLAAIMEGTIETAKKLPVFLALASSGAVNPLAAVEMALGSVSEETDKAFDRLAARIRAASGDGKDRITLPKATVPTEEFRDATGLVDRMRMKLAEARGEESKLTEEARQFQGEITRASEKLEKLKSEGKISPPDLKRETSAIAESIGLLGSWTRAAIEKFDATRLAAAQKGAREIADLAEQQETETYDIRLIGWNREIDGLRAKLIKEKALTAENAAALEALRKAGIAKLDQEQAQAYIAEMMRLGGFLDQYRMARATARERIDMEHQEDLLKWSKWEMDKALLVADGEEQEDRIREQFRRGREEAERNHQLRMQEYRNGLGLQGMIGSAFADDLRGNEELWREWSESADRSTMTVRMSLESLKNLGSQAFMGMAQGMAQAAASSIVYSKSMKEAMQSALASVLANVAAEAYVRAIYCTALGFLYLAQWNFSGAAQAFAAAALFGAVGTAAALVGRAVAPKSKTDTSLGAGSGSTASSSDYGSGSGTASKQSGPQVAVYVYGGIYGGPAGIDELAGAISDAVQNRDVKMISSGTKAAGAGGRA